MARLSSLTPLLPVLCPCENVWSLPEGRILSSSSSFLWPWPPAANFAEPMFCLPVLFWFSLSYLVASFSPFRLKQGTLWKSLSLIVFPAGFLPSIPQFQPSTAFSFQLYFHDAPKYTSPQISLQDYNSIFRDLLDMATQFSYDIFHFSLSTI